MPKTIAIHEGVIRSSLVQELEAVRAPEGRVSSYYLDVDVRRWGSVDATRIALQNALKRERTRIEELDVPHEVRESLLRDWELIRETAPTVIGERHTRSIACFVATEARKEWALRLPCPARNRAFFEDRFVLWPLRLLLDQSDRYGIILTDKDDARLFLYYMEQIEEVTTVMDVLPGRIRYPDPFREREYMDKHIEYFHRHFERVNETALRLFQKEPFEHLIIGGLWETLPQFGSRLHRYLRDRIIARWDVNVFTPTPKILERAQQEEQQFLDRQAREIWKTIQDEVPRLGVLGPDSVFAALWQRRVDALLIEPDVSRKGYRCSSCGRLSLTADPCVECGGKKVDVPDVYEEAVLDAIDQSSHVRYWKDQVLNKVDSISALKRY